MRNLHLLPRPRRIADGEGTLPLAGVRRVVVDQRIAGDLAVGMRQLVDALRERCAIPVSASAEARPAPAADAVTVELTPGEPAAQGYRLRVGAQGIVISAADAAGAYYALQTLIQLARIADPLPGVVIEDWPDFPARGAMLDISRARVPTMATLRALIDRLASWKFNQLQLYTEHTFAYRDHAEVWAECSPITAAEAIELDAYCRERFIELVPNQNSFGHLNRWLTLPRYRPLADRPEDVGGGWGPGNLCPTDPASVAFVRGLYAELLPNFSSRMINVGCDEVVLGGRSAAACAQRGAVEVYLDFLASIHGLAAEHGRRIQFWGDIVAHHPERISRIPRDAIGLAWGYEIDHPFAGQARAFRDAGLECYVCPGTSGWGSLGGRTSVMEANQRKAAAEGRANGATGFLTTDWGNGGHPQQLPTSELALATGGAMAWCVEANPGLDRAAADAQVFRDDAGVLASIVAELGEVHREIPKPVSDGAWPYHLLCLPLGQRPDPGQLTRDGLRRTMARIDDAIRPLDAARCVRADAELVVAEVAHTASLLRLACRTGLRLLGDDAPDASPEALATDLRVTRGEHAIRWLARSRPGGLSESLHFLTNGVAATIGEDRPWYWGGVRM